MDYNNGFHETGVWRTKEVNDSHFIVKTMPHAHARIKLQETENCV